MPTGRRMDLEELKEPLERALDHAVDIDGRIELLEEDSMDVASEFMDSDPEVDQLSRAYCIETCGEYSVAELVEEWQERRKQS